MYITYGKTDKLIAMYSEGKNTVVADGLEQVKISPTVSQQRDIELGEFQVYYENKRLKFQNKTSRLNT